MITVRESEQRGTSAHGWLDTQHTFSFDEYQDPRFMDFRSLRVINEHRAMGGAGFPTQMRQNVEILGYVVSGSLRHADSMGHTSVLQAGDVQRISAGTGIAHSEVNNSDTEPVHFLQIWIQPSRLGAPPRYDQRAFAGCQSGGLHLVASPMGRAGSLSIHRDAEVSLARLARADRLSIPLASGRHAWLQVIEGELTLNGRRLRAGDGVAASQEASLELAARTPVHFLFFDLD